MHINPNESGVYLIHCKVNHKIYIGSSYKVKNRWNRHMSSLKYNKHSNKSLQKDWDLYGGSAFEFEVLEYCEKEELLELESFYICSFGSITPVIGYNIDVPDIRYRGLISKGCNEKKVINDKVVVQKDHFVYCLRKGEATVKYQNAVITAKELNIPYKKVTDVLAYWTHIKDNIRKGRKSLNGWIFVYEEVYDTGFNYFSFKKEPIPKEKKGPKSRRKRPEDIIPYEQRRLKRTPVRIVNEVTKEERIYECINWATKELNLSRSKVNDCLKGERKTYRGFSFHRLNAGVAA